jgi:hydrogenase maturation protein HypF
MGRLFDAVASVLNLCNTTSYHGEAAMLLEALATTSNTKNIQSYPICFENNHPQIDKMLQGILLDLELSIKPNLIAWKFHKSLAEIISQTASQQKIQNLAFSGGVFQNKLLVDLIIQNLNKKHQLHFHKQLSPNDECIAYGQLMHFGITDKSHDL